MSKTAESANSCGSVAPAYAGQEPISGTPLPLSVRMVRDTDWGRRAPDSRREAARVCGGLGLKTLMKTQRVARSIAYEDDSGARSHRAI